MRARPAFRAMLAAGVFALSVASAPLAAQSARPRSSHPAAALRVGTVPGPGADRLSPSPHQEAQDTTPPMVSPGGAFLRSLLVPGWGNAAVGSYGRAGFYFVTSAAIGWMLFKTSHYLGAARADRALAQSELEAQLRRQGITDPDTLSARVTADTGVKGLTALESARSSQMQDWTALGVFWLLLNATDAFVSAHLANFPKPVEIEVRPPDAPGARSEFRLSVPVGR